jgi:hypothetical protein
MGLSIADAPYKLSPVVNGVISTLTASADAMGIAVNPGTQDPDIYYGDQVLIPRNPAICVEPGPLKRTLDGASNPPRMQNDFTVLILVYIQEINDIQQVNRDRDALLDQVQDVMHADWTLGGLLVFGHCTDIDPGYAIRSGKLVRCGRITYEGMNKSFLIDNANVQ